MERGKALLYRMSQTIKPVFGFQKRLKVVEKTNLVFVKHDR